MGRVFGPRSLRIFMTADRERRVPVGRPRLVSGHADRRGADDVWQSDRAGSLKRLCAADLVRLSLDLRNELRHGRKRGRRALARGDALGGLESSPWPPQAAKAETAEAVRTREAINLRMEAINLRMDWSVEVIIISRLRNRLAGGAGNDARTGEANAGGRVGHQYLHKVPRRLPRARTPMREHPRRA